MISRRPILAVLFALCAAAPFIAVPASAEDQAPKALIRKTVDQALAVLRDPSLQGPDKRAQRLDKVRDVVSGVFDWEDMARRSLGVHWRSADEQQRSRFVELFKELLADRYMEDISRFRGDEQVKVEQMHQEGDVYRVDTTIITHSREKVPISYFLHQEGSSYRVHDFSVEGVSLVNHYRKLFSRFLVNHKFDALIQKLARKAPSAGDSSAKSGGTGP